MEFGKVDQVQGIDFQLSGDHPLCERILRMNTPSDHVPWLLGLTGWGEPSWRGDVYPPVCKPAYFLRTYTLSYSCVELNSTFYHIPSSEQIQSWAKQVPPDFRFYPKIWQGISHRKGFSPTLIPMFQEAMKGFGQHLGACFLQLPPTIDGTNIPWLTDLLTQWDAGQQLFLEIRNPDLIRSDTLLDLLQSLRIGLVLTDVPGHRDLAHMCLTTPSFLLRFVAASEEGIDRARIRDWCQRLGQWASNGLHQAIVFCHTADNLHAPHLSRIWLEESRHFGISLNSGKTPLDYRGTNQKTLFE